MRVFIFICLFFSYEMQIQATAESCLCSDQSKLTRDEENEVIEFAREHLDSRLKISLKTIEDLKKQLSERVFKTQDSSNQMALILVAIYQNRVDIVRLLTRLGEGIKSFEAVKNIALRAAIREAYPEIVGILIDAGANLNLLHHGVTPLMLATSLEGNRPGDSLGFQSSPPEELRRVAAGRLESLKLLLKAKANPNILSDRLQPIDYRNPIRVTALVQAILHGNFEAVDLLVESGANVNQISYICDIAFTPLQVAVTRINSQSLKIIKYLLGKKANIYLRTQNGENLLHLLTRTYNGLFQETKKQQAMEILNFLLDFYPEFTHEENSINWSPFVFASGSDIEIISTLLGAGAGSIEEINYALSEAISIYGNIDVEIIKVFLSYGADVNERDASGNTVLLRLINTLLEILSSRPYESYTYFYKIKGIVRVIDVLLRHGADLTKRNKLGESVDDVIEKSGFIMLRKLIEEESLRASSHLTDEEWRESEAFRIIELYTESAEEMHVDLFDDSETVANSNQSSNSLVSSVLNLCVIL